MIMSIIGGMHHRYIYINNGMARYTLSIRMDKRNRTCIESSIRLLEIQDYLCEWLNTRYGYSYGLLSRASDSNMLQVVLDIWDTHYGGLQHIFAPEVVQLLTSFTA